jgi:iron complex outermembrane receptor protein
MNRSHLVAAFVVAAIAATRSGVAHADDTTTATDSSDTLNEVVVTGTRVAGQSQINSISPVQVISTPQLADQGTRELGAALATVAPSLDFPRPSLTDGSDTVRPATLRGLSPDETLVLVDSKRQHAAALVNINGTVGRGSAAVDLDTIPVAALDRVEVLTDGASAQYGSDAIAGVINLHLREARSGGEAEITYGLYDTDVDTDHGSRHVNDGNQINASTWAGFGLGADGFLTVTGEFRDQDPTSRGDYDQRVNPPAVIGRFGDPHAKNYTFWANAGLPLSDGWKLYGWAGFQDRDSSSAEGPRYTQISASYASPLHPNGYLPLLEPTVLDLSSTFGAKGDVVGWATDVSIGYGRNRIGYYTDNTANVTYGANSPTDFNDGALIYDQWVFNLDVVRDFDLGLTAPLNVAWGAEGREESYIVEAGVPASWNFGPNYVKGQSPGAQGFGGLEPSNAVDVHRTSESLYLDLATHLTRALNADVAVRGEHYQDFGTIATEKLGLRYDFTPRFALRGTASTGFRAPSLQQEYFTATSSNFLSNNSTVPVQTGTFPATSAIAEALGGKALGPEKSDNYSVGGVYHVGSFEATVDAYRIYIRNRLFLSENLNSANVVALLQPYGVSAARFFINGIDTRTQGVDTVLRYALDTTSTGKFNFSVSHNLNKTEAGYVQTSTSVLPDVVLFGRQNLLRITRGTPSNKLILDTIWNYPLEGAVLDVNAKATRYGAVLSPSSALTAAAYTPSNPDLLINPAWIADLEVGAEVGEHLHFALGADNLFDKYPNILPTAVNPTGSSSFSSFSPYGFNGRFIYARANYHW